MLPGVSRGDMLNMTKHVALVESIREHAERVRARKSKGEGD